MNDSQRIQKIDAFIEQNKDALLRDLKTLVCIPSVQSAPEPGAPFGADVRKALDTALDMARGFGLETHDCEGYMGYAQITGKSEKQIATIAHLDVVPEGNGWDSNPFDLVERDGYVIGRGTADDKGPAVLTLYAAKFFKEQGEELPYTLRILLGCAEETGMEDVDYYLSRYPQPAFCFTPDGEFPVGYGEKGHYGGTFTSAALTGNLVRMEGGVATNVVPDRAFAIVKADAAGLADTDRVKVTQEGEGLVRITGYGKGGHASLPEGTVNAIALVVDYLLDHDLCSEEENTVLRMERELLRVTDGSFAGIDCEDKVFSPLTCIGGTVETRDGRLCQTIDIRYPTCITAETMQEKLNAFAAGYGAVFEGEKPAIPFYIDPNSAAIRTLIDTYNEVTGQNKKPFTMGGGTYARHFANAVSFGMEEPEEPVPDFVGAMHGANEGVPVARLLQSLKIYILALSRLMELEF